MTSLIESTPAGIDAADMLGVSTNQNLPGVIALVLHHRRNLGGFYIEKQSTMLVLAFPDLISVGYGIAVEENAELTSLSAPLLESILNGLTILQNPRLPIVDFPELVSANALYISSNNVLKEIRLPKFEGVLSANSSLASNPLLASIDLRSLVTTGNQGLNVSANPALTNLMLSKLQTVTGSLNLAGDTALASLNLPALVSAASAFLASLNAAGCSSLANVSLPLYEPSNGRNQTFSGCALSQASVDHILARCVASAAYVSGTVNLSGGTSSAPSAAGLVDKATLQGRGVTVLTN